MARWFADLLTGNKLNRELSGTGRIAGLYSDFGDQRIQPDVVHAPEQDAESD
jgi:hypothetical protein